MIATGTADLPERLRLSMPRLISHRTSLCRSRTPRRPRRSESAHLCAPRGGCCRFVMRSAGPSRQQSLSRLVTTGWAVVVSPPPGLCSRRCSSVSGSMPNAVWRQCDVRATAKASDGMLLSGSGVPIPGCRSPLPLQVGPTFAFQEIGLGLFNANRRGRPGEGHWQPTSVTALGGFQSAMAGSQQACPS
jgi:hypothetical protein